MHSIFSCDNCRCGLAITGNRLAGQILLGLSDGRKDQRNYAGAGGVQLGDNTFYIGDNLVYLRCGWPILGQNEKVSTINARVRVTFQLQTKRQHEPKLASKVCRSFENLYFIILFLFFPQKSDSSVSGQLGPSMPIAVLLHGFVGTESQLICRHCKAA